MEKIFLLPNGFKKVGWIILVPTFVLGVLMTIDGYNGFPSFLATRMDSFGYEKSTDFGLGWKNIE